MEWLSQHWEWVLMGAVVLSSVLNIVTKHYGSASPRLMQALLFVIDLLSVLVSKGSPGLVKAPLIPSPAPKPYVEVIKKIRGEK
jgi:hypothetical protein